MPRITKQNHITSADKTALINKNNMRLKKDFLLYLKSIKRSAGTISGYDNDLLIVFTFIMEELNNKDFNKLTKRDIISIQNWLVDNGNSPARIRRIKSAISSLSNYCSNILADDDPEYEGYRPIVRKIENPALLPVREKTVMTAEEVQDMLDKLVERKKYEIACFTALAAFGGRRKAEICRFRVSDFSEDKIVCGGSLWKSDPIKTKGRSDGKYLNCYTLVNKFRPYLEMWMKERERLGIESEWLFPDSRDYSKELPISTANSWAQVISRMIGIDFYYHCMRHNYTTMLSDNGIPDSVIKEILGWSDISMVSVYIDRTTDATLDMFFGGETGFKTVKKKTLEEI